MAQENRILVGVLRQTIEALERKNPSLFVHGRSYAINLLLNEAAGLAPPLPPPLRKAEGGRHSCKKRWSATKKKNAKSRKKK